MKRTILFIILFLLTSNLILCQELDKSDWDHILIPAEGYLVSAQLLPVFGLNVKHSEEISLAGAMLINIGKEYYDYRKGGVSSLEDMELSLVGIAASYYLNRALNRLIRPQEGKREITP